MKYSMKEEINAQAKPEKVNIVKAEIINKYNSKQNMCVQCILHSKSFHRL